MRNWDILANNDRVVRCKNCMHYTATKYTETGFHCGLHSEGETYVETAPDDFCSYGEREAAKSEPIIDRATYEQAQEKIKDRKGTPAPSTAVYKRQPSLKYPRDPENIYQAPLGYKWQDGKLVIDEAEAELVQRAAAEMVKDGQVSMETYHELVKARKARTEAQKKGDPAT